MINMRNNYSSRHRYRDGSVVGGIIVLVLSYLLINVFHFGSHDAIKQDKSIRYYEFGLIYRIYNYDTSTVSIAVSSEVQCIKAPCDPIYIHTYRINNNDEYRALLNNMYNSKNGDAYLTKSDISASDYLVLEKILKEDYSRKKNYVITNINDSKYKTRGYYIEQDEEYTYIIISMGEKNTGGYRIDVDNVRFDNHDITIKVSETVPGKGETTTMAFTYPSVKVQLLFKPPKIKVVSDNNEEFKLIKK